MTLGRLIKQLQELEKEHGSRIRVTANTFALRHTCNAVWDIIDVTEIIVDDVRQVDGDGYGVCRKDGTESTRKCVVLS